MKVGILFDAGSSDWEQKDVAAVLANVNEVQAELKQGGHETSLIPVQLGDVRWLKRVQKQDLIFNLCEGVNGYARYEDFAVAALEPKFFAELVQRLPGDARYEPGLIMEFAAGDGSKHAGLVREVDDHGATVDFNHPLAGKTLSFDIKITNVKPAAK